MNPENNILSEISQTQNDKHCMIHLHEISRIDKFIKTENKTRGYQGLGEGGIESYCLMGTEFLFGVMRF